MRRLYECQLDLAEKGEAEEPPDPFDNGNPITFVDWLNEPSESIGISRYLLRLWRERPDIQEAFPDIGGQDAERYLCALIATGESAEGLPSELLPTRPGSFVISRLLPSSSRLASMWLATSPPSSESARPRGNSWARSRGPVPHSTIVHRDTASRQDHKFHEDGVQAARFDTNLLCINADRLPQFAHNVAPTLFDGRYSIGVWWWEVSVFPEELHEASTLSTRSGLEASSSAEAISASTSKPVLALPLPVSVPSRPR